MKHGDIRIIKRFIFGITELNGVTKRWQWAYIRQKFVDRWKFVGWVDDSWATKEEYDDYKKQ